MLEPQKRLAHKYTHLQTDRQTYMHACIHAKICAHTHTLCKTPDNATTRSNISLTSSPTNYEVPITTK